MYVSQKDMVSLLSCTGLYEEFFWMYIRYIYIQVFLLPQGHYCFQSSFYRNQWACSRETCQQIKSNGSRVWLLSRCPLLYIPTFGPTILCPMWNLCIVLERGSFDNMRLGQCYPVEPVQTWPESSGLFCTAYTFPWNPIFKYPRLGSLPVWMHPSSLIFLCPQTFFSLVPPRMILGLVHLASWFWKTRTVSLAHLYTVPSRRSFLELSVCPAVRICLFSV